VRIHEQVTAVSEQMGLGTMTSIQNAKAIIFESTPIKCQSSRTKDKEGNINKIRKYMNTMTIRNGVVSRTKY